MSTIIKFKKAIDLRGKNGDGAYIKRLQLRDMTAGDYLDASAKLRPNAGQMELEMEVASVCSDVSMAVLRAMRPYDMAQVSRWFDSQWAPPKSEDGEAEDQPEDPSEAGAAG